MLPITFRLTAVIAFGLAASETILAEPPEPRPESARVRALAESLDRGVPDAEQAFWNEVSSKGAPLVEALESQPGYARVTFLWKGVSSQTHSVRLISGPQILRHFKDLNFVRLPRSNVWFLTLNIPTGWRVAYMLAENAEPHGFPKSARSDPFNPRNSEQDSSHPVPVARLFSIFETPGAPPEPWLRLHRGVPAGTVEIRQVQSRVLGSERTVAVYLPHGFGSFNDRPGSLYLFDGDEYLRDMRVADVLDNLIGERKIAPVFAVLIQDLRGRDRDHELSCDPKFTEFLATELVPWVRANFQVSEDPRKTIIGGSSLGGLEAAFAASRHRELFGAVLTQSGSFWWRPNAPAAGSTEPWMAEEFQKGNKSPLRFFLSAGRDELDQSGLGGGLIDNRRMQAALVESRYDVKYEEIEGQHDWINWRLTLPDGLMFLDPLPAP